ncbi:MAG TPA: bifunctional YncE family protein/alkaline phosphatase family protein [Gemmataceae bacterium]|nr:bifunctional YncE family protein/alkaline phosphatase family protein [Gemmataceae bacterium]
MRPFHVLAMVLLVMPFARAQEAPRKDSSSKQLRLPGAQPEGTILLHNQWSLKPAGKQLELGDFPVNSALHPSGKWLAVLHAGHGEHEIVIVDLSGSRQKIRSRVTVDQTFYGLCFSADGKHLYASGGEFEIVHAFAFGEGLLSEHRRIAVAKPSQTFVPAGLAVDGDSKTLFAAGAWGHAVAIVPLENPNDRRSIALGKDSYPYACAVNAAGTRLYVSLWNKASVAVINVGEAKVVGNIPTELHPTEMALAADGKTLFVACANSTRVSVIDTAAGKARETISCALYPSAPTGNTPNSLALTPDGEMLFVANADANNVSVFRVSPSGEEAARPLGFIPAGWYPTSVRYDPADRRIYVCSGRGATPKANPHGPNPLLPRNKTTREYIGDLYRGTLNIVDLPTPEKMAAYSKDAYACSPLRADQSVPRLPPKDSPVPARVGDPSPIRHCLYIIKENRTYDQVLGDMKEGNGDRNLCLFPESITPNHHRLAREFVLLDNFYVDGEVSASGHEWSMGAYATDFVQKVWPLVYRGSPLRKLDKYPAEGNMDAIARPAGGYLWDRCAEAGVSYRSYGEWIDNGKTPDVPGRARVKALEGHFDPLFRGFDLDYSEQKRADRFIEELGRFEREGDLPRLVILRLPNDHTSGAKVGKPTPTAYVADNDLALGRVVEAVSKSKFWKDTAIFVVEDDAQNGSDHVDAHRTVAYVISPYARRGQVDSTMYSTTSMLRTMELILGLKPMSQFDAAAQPMYGAFQAHADTGSYQHAVPAVDLTEKNQATAWGAKLSEKFDFTKEDAADDLLLSEVIWRSVRGPNSPMPAPVRSAFVFPHLKEGKQDKD